MQAISADCLVETGSHRLCPWNKKLSLKGSCFLHELQIKAEQHSADRNAEQHPQDALHLLQNEQKRMNHRALPGSASRIKNAPRPPPIHAPKIGTSAVMVTNAETAPAYGIPRISIPKKHRTPMITASVSCPLTKFVKVWLVREAIPRSRCAFFCGRAVTTSLFKCAATTSF